MRTEAFARDYPRLVPVDPYKIGHGHGGAEHHEATGHGEGGPASKR